MSHIAPSTYLHLQTPTPATTEALSDCHLAWVQRVYSRVGPEYFCQSCRRRCEPVHGQDLPKHLADLAEYVAQSMDGLQLTRFLARRTPGARALALDSYASLRALALMVAEDLGAMSSAGIGVRTSGQINSINLQAHAHSWHGETIRLGWRPSDSVPTLRRMS